MGDKRKTYQQQRQRESGRKQRLILRAAGQCFARRGYRKTTVAEIAQQAEVSKGLVFHLFDTKEKLFTAVVEDGLEHWAQLSDYRATEVQDTSAEELRVLFLTSFNFIDQHPVIALFAHAEESILSKHKPEFAKMNKRWRRRIKRALKRGVEQSELRPELDIERATTIFHELQATLLQRVSLHQGATRLDRGTVELAIDVFLRGIKVS